MNPTVQTLAALGLLLNALAWGLSWWPFRELQKLGLHPLWSNTLIYGIAVVAIFIARPNAWRGMLALPALWLLALGAGLTNVGFNWAVTVGDVVRVVLLFYLMPAWSILLKSPRGVRWRAWCWRWPVWPWCSKRRNRLGRCRRACPIGWP
jgi:drug/metabolite transporter (DMT)-like permease